MIFKVFTSHRQSETAATDNLRVYLQKKHSWVVTTNCSCMAGLGSVCIYVANLLFKIELACHLKLTESISPTKVICEWKNRKPLFFSQKLLQQKSFPWYSSFDQWWVEKTNPRKPSLCSFHKYWLVLLLYIIKKPWFSNWFFHRNWRNYHPWTVNISS